MADSTAVRFPTTALRTSGGPVLLAGFAVALFGSAFLLFSVQPMVSRLILPRLGGAPAVWNTCVCFFQAALLVGYGYAHLSTTRLPQAVQVALHAGLLLGAGLLLPLSLGGAPPPEDAPVSWLLQLLVLRVGLPFAAIAATAPLLQAWFARTSHPQARDPYFLYAASNAGSLLALLGYPVVIETTLGLSSQIRFWAAGFAVIAAAVLSCGTAALLRPGAAATAATQPYAGASVRERVRWVTLAFVPSALMLAVTTHITTDIASVPLFWVLPLAIYILTFVLAFGRWQPVGLRPLLAVQAVTLAGAAGTAYVGSQSVPTVILQLAAFALTAAVCHWQLAARRPPAQGLTGYFFLISFGGALGGLLNALVAPVIFPIPLEYPLLLAAACLLRPPPPRHATQRQRDWAIRGDLVLPVALLLSVIAVVPAVRYAVPDWAVMATGAALTAAGLLWFAQRRVRLTITVLGCFALPMLSNAHQALTVVRTFFGVLLVRDVPDADLILLQHGTTVHGLQGTRPGEETTPYGYYRRDGGFGRLFAALDASGAPPSSVGVIGLGIGSLACYAQPGSSWTFYEIDPAVERLARNAKWFHFLERCGTNAAVVLGDARLRIGASPVRHDVLIVDAFSSDSVPVHLLTREALAIYRAHLNEGGTVLFHLSNRYLTLAPVVARIAANAGMPARHLLSPQSLGGLRGGGMEVLAISDRPATLDALTADGWDVPQPGPVLWTDERSDILGLIDWR